MFKQVIFAIMISLSITAYADNSTGNIVLSTPKDTSLSSVKSLNIKYTIFDYQMAQDEFASFLVEHKLNQKPTTTNSVKNIVYTDILQKKEFDIFNQKFTKQFSNKTSGGSRCIVGNEVLCGGTRNSSALKTIESKTPVINTFSILFKTYVDTSKNVSVKITSDKSMNVSPLISFQSNILLTNVVKNKDYIVISQVSESGVLYGQIILVSFVTGT
jgi:hypothetical protein